MTMSGNDYPFPIVLQPVQVPEGYYPIEIRQFWRGEHVRGIPLPLHWSIVVRTSPARGNTHEIVGGVDTFATQDRFNVPLREDGGWRGTHVVGYVSPAKMDTLWSRIALVPVPRGRWPWSCRNWAYEVLEELRGPGGENDNEDDRGMYVDENVTFHRLQAHMLCLLEAWEQGDI